MKVGLGTWTIFAFLFAGPAMATAEIKIAIARSQIEEEFQFPGITPPARNDAATNATWKLLEGSPDSNSGQLSALYDGQLPEGDDDPRRNFFFAAGSSGGRILLDLGKPISIRQINSFSWHPAARSPQVYHVYAATGQEKNFLSEPTRPQDPESCGWTSITSVNTIEGAEISGGQQAVQISSANGPVGEYRHLLFDVQPTETDDRFGNTFFSEIDVIDANGDSPQPVQMDSASKKTIIRFQTPDNKYQFRIDATVAPDLADWSEKHLAQTIIKWYPQIVEKLPSDGFSPPHEVLLKYRDDMGRVPASAGGATVNLNARWFRSELDREAQGAVIHELAHVVQCYNRIRQRDRNATSPPGWVVEGIPDAIRWFQYEPEKQGAKITRNNIHNARYDASYRITANFLNYVETHHNPLILQHLNAAARTGVYSDELWKTWTKKSLPELADEWKAFNEQQLQGK